MRYSRPCCAALVAVALLCSFSFASDEKNKKEPFSRRNPVVEAVEKTKQGIVAIRVPQQGERDMVGSGVIFDERGYVVTNRHVTADRDEIGVRLHDGTDLKGKVVWKDCDLDLAIVRMDTNKKLTALPWAPTNDLMVGETVIAIGSPFGYDATVTSGIISALNRQIRMPNEVMARGLIQHSAPINPGNSGGPLVNINAEVIGINVAMRDGAQNIAFAINSTTVKNFLKAYSNKIARVEHGIKTEEKVVGEVGDRQRVVVKNASHADLKSGDEIRAIGECKVVNAIDLDRAMWNRNPGQQVELKVVRQGREMSVTLTLEASHGAGSVTAASVPPSQPAIGGSAVTQESVRSASGR